MKIEWTNPAVDDVLAIKHYIARDSEAYAERFAERIIEAAESLNSLPGRGRAVPEANDDSIRELIFGNYRIIYRLEEERVLLLTVIHAARNLAAR
jgi:toxin ParE1/3/4